MEGGMFELTAENANAEAHRLAGDTLVVRCVSCDHGEVVVTDLIEEPVGECLECGAQYRLLLERVDG